MAVFVSGVWGLYYYYSGDRMMFFKGFCCDWLDALCRMLYATDAASGLL